MTSPTTRVNAQFVKADGTTVDVRSVEFFRVHDMIWLRHLRFEPNSILEVVIDHRRRAVKSIVNRDQVCEIRLASE